MWATPWNGRRWCSQGEYIGMSRTMTISSWSIENVFSRTSAGSCHNPANSSRAARATRPGVSARPSRSGSSPIARRNSRTAACARGTSTGPIIAALPTSSLGSGLDTATLGHLDDLGRRVLLGPWVGAVLGRLVDGGRGAGVGWGDRGAGRGRDAVVAVGGRLLRRGQDRREVGQRPMGAREPGGAQRALDDLVEDPGELALVEALAFEQLEHEGVEDVTVVVDDVPRLVVSVVDELADLFVDDGRDLLGVVALVAHVAAEEHLALRLAELDGTDPLAHAVLGDHLAGHRRGLLDVVGGARRRVVEDDLLGDATAEGVGQLVEDLVARRRVLVVGRHDHRVAERTATRQDRHLRDGVGVVHRRRDEGVAALVVRRDLPLLGRHDPRALLRAGDDAVDRLVEHLVVDELLVGARREQGRLVEDVGQVRTGEAGRASGDGEQVDTGGHRLALSVHLEDAVT